MHCLNIRCWWVSSFSFQMLTGKSESAVTATVSSWRVLEVGAGRLSRPDVTEDAKLLWLLFSCTVLQDSLLIDILCCFGFRTLILIQMMNWMHILRIWSWKETEQLQYKSWRGAEELAAAKGDVNLCAGGLGQLMREFFRHCSCWCTPCSCDCTWETFVLLPGKVLTL